jgi:hypothetical protein
MPVIGLFSPEEIEEKMKNIRPSTGAPPEANAHMEEALKNVLSDAKDKKKKSKKKKSKKSAAQAELLFEGGDSSSEDGSDGFLPEYEGGSGDEDNDEMAETVRPKGKKKKKAPKKQESLFSKGGTAKFEDSNLNGSPDRSPEPSPTRKAI